MMRAERVGVFAASKRRDAADVALAILGFCSQGPQQPTQLMYRANVSYGRLQELTGSLVEKGLLERIPGPNPRKHVFETTEKGLRWLELRREASRLEEGSS